MQRHTWREQSEEGVRLFRASYHAGNWTLQSQLKGDEHWHCHEPLTAADWRTLRGVLWRKYQRRRCPWELIEKIDRRIEDLEGEEVARDPSSPDGLRPRESGEPGEQEQNSVEE